MAGSCPYPEEGEVTMVLHMNDLQVAHHDLTAHVPVPHGGIVELWVARETQAILGTWTNCDERQR